MDFHYIWHEHRVTTGHPASVHLFLTASNIKVTVLRTFEVDEAAAVYLFFL
jgi:hypothetical protein